MIRLLLERVRDGRDRYSDRREEPVFDALSLLVQCELAFGAHIVDSTSRRLVTRTSVMGVVDTTTFTGSQTDMRPLLQSAAYYTQAAEDPNGYVMEGVLADLARFPNGEGGNPRIISLAAPILLGRNRLQLAMMLPLGINNPQDLSAGMQLPLNDLIAALALQQENPQLSLSEVIYETRS